MSVSKIFLDVDGEQLRVVDYRDGQYGIHSYDKDTRVNDTKIFDKDDIVAIRNYLIELLPLDGNIVSQPQLEQVGDMGVLVDTRPLPMTINVTGNVYINQIEKGE